MSVDGFLMEFARGRTLSDYKIKEYDAIYRWPTAARFVVSPSRRIWRPSDVYTDAGSGSGCEKCSLADPSESVEEDAVEEECQRASKKSRLLKKIQKMKQLLKKMKKQIADEDW